MAVRGPRPKANVVRLVTGIKPNGTGGAPAANRIKPPVKMTGRAAAIWKTTIRDGAPWLAQPDAAMAWAFCELQAEAETGFAAMTASRIAQWRALANELGLTPSSRERLGVQATPPVADPLDHYFTT